MVDKKSEHELPPLPNGWVWELDLDGCWAAYIDTSKGRVRCFAAADPPEDCVRFNQTTTEMIPVRVVVAVAIANHIDYEPSDKPIEEWQWTNGRE